MGNPAPGFTRYPDHRVVVTPSRKHVRVLVGDRAIADTRAALYVEESRHDAVWYFSPKDVDEQLLTPTETSTYCPFKGYASYWTIEDGDDRLEDAVWGYLAPFDECRELEGYYAFFTDRVRLEVDGQIQRPT